MKKSKNFAFLFVNELIDLKVNEIIEITPGFNLMKADESLISLIKRSLPYIGTISEENPFESYIPTNGLRSKLEDSDFRYSVIEFDFELPLSIGGQFSPPFFIEALAISNLNLNTLALFVYIFEVEYDDYEVGFQHEQIRGYTLFTDTHNTFGVNESIRKKPLKSQITDFHEVYRGLTTLLNTNENHFILKAVTDYVKIKEISIHNPFRILSYFSILELLVTYPPKNSGDNSLNKQLSMKTKFLVNNYLKQVDFTAYFNGSDSNTIETVMRKLYTYRSDIAHGNVSDFEKDLKIIKNDNSHIQSFLDELTREVIRLGIHKPSLLSDLKEI